MSGYLTISTSYLDASINVEKSREMPRNVGKCRERSSFENFNFLEFQVDLGECDMSRKVEKSRVLSKNVEKCRAMSSFVEVASGGGGVGPYSTTQKQINLNEKIWMLANYIAFIVMLTTKTFFFALFFYPFDKVRSPIISSKYQLCFELPTFIFYIVKVV